MATQLTETAGLLVTRKQLADIFGAHMQTITKWEQEGMPVETRGARGKPSLYRSKACIEWYGRREAARGSDDPAALSPQAQRALLDEKRREDLDLRIRLRKGELIEVDEAARDLANVAAATKARLRRIPDGVAHQLVTVAQQGPAAVKTMLLTEIDEALRELAGHGESTESAA